MQTSNLRANQQTMAELTRLIKFGNNLLESHFQKLLQGETPPKVEVLHFITKDKPFPALSQDKYARLGLITSYISANARQNSMITGPQDSSVGKLYVEIRGRYLLSSLSTLATASVNTSKKVNPDAMYRAGTNAIGSYAKAMEGIFLAEYDNVCSIFAREDWGPLFQAVCQPSLAELARTLREINNHIKGHLNTDCFLAFEITDVMSTLTSGIESRTGELKGSLAAALKPIRETSKTSLSEILDDSRRKASGLQTLPPDGAPVPLVSETVKRLQNMAEFIGPISAIMIAVGDGGWRTSAGPRAGDRAPSLASFDVAADGKKIFANYCVDFIEGLLSALGHRGSALLKGKAVQGVFLGNCVVIVERMIRDSDLSRLLESRGAMLDQWRKRAVALYTDPCKDLSMHLFDVIKTNRARPASGQAADSSASALKGLSTKDRDSIKGKFQAFNAGFDEMVARHRSYSMEREVRQMFARAVQQMLEPLYNRFWDRYHEIDKGKGKHVKYDKSSIAAVFMSLY